ncbi:hypothetical protein NP493_2005g00027 [Ridgeia piscesae]|uniref:Chitin-binding type-2 domain-containing protein n=1 Tax=Ridgeia piscesae TaxID=27915 RepID=A0AAD9JP86_RIDPI|nr:hypothetical protein NP493_2005g00027 [Ridgeia piscesae]
MNKLIFVVLALAAVAVSAFPHYKMYNCTDSCDGLPDGQYPTACKECPHYFRCRNGILTYKKCRGNLCYYPVTCRCQRHCPSGRHGIDTCIGVRDGNYQHCYLCSIYVQCEKGHMLMVMLCPFPLVWDDNSKSCVRRSNTCCRPFYK